MQAVFSVFESWTWETLGTPQPDDTSASNESSVMLFGDVGGNRLLLTGDAGVEDLAEAYNYAVRRGLRVEQPDLVQMPHHGSRRNVSPSVLDLILGRRLPSPGVIRGSAVASAGQEDTDHPRRVTLNAFTRRGYNCAATNGLTINYRHNFPPRPGLTPLTPFPLYDQVEE